MRRSTPRATAGRKAPAKTEQIPESVDVSPEKETPKVATKVPRKTPAKAPKSDDTVEIAFLSYAERYLEALGGKDCTKDTSKSVERLTAILREASLDVAVYITSYPDRHKDVSLMKCSKMNILVNELLHEYSITQDYNLAKASIFEAVISVCNTM